MPSKPSEAGPSRGPQWVQGAEPVALCLSCNSTFPPDTRECPQCHVGLSLIRRCPVCERTLSANHLTCIYCATSFVRDISFVPAGGPGALRDVELHHWYRWIAVVAAVSVVVVLAGVYWLRWAKPRPAVMLGQSYVLVATSVRANPSLGAPPIKDLAVSEIVNITGFEIDGMGKRWFQISAGEMTGYVRTEELSPPKGVDADKTFEALRHSLLGLNDPDVVPAAVEAVDFYRRAFPESLHGDDVAWLLAERARELAARGGERRPALLGVARTHYEIVAKGESDFAPRARQTLASWEEETPAAAGAKRATPSRKRAEPLRFRVMGGEVRGEGNGRPARTAPKPPEPKTGGSGSGQNDRNAATADE